jgi:hypothetical protein
MMNGNVRTPSRRVESIDGMSLMPLFDAANLIAPLYPLVTIFAFSYR